MKKVLPILAIASLALLACGKTPDPVPDNEDNGLYDLSQVTVMRSGTISLENFYQGLLQEASSTNDDFDQNLYDYYALLLSQVKKTKGDSDANVTMSYAWTILRYMTQDVSGNNIECSEVLVWPHNTEGPALARNVVIGCHLTITGDEQRPSNLTNPGVSSDANLIATFASPLSQNALVILPDYEGYGVTRSRHHPYCNREVTARQVVDGAKAGIAWFEKQGNKLADGWKSVAVGYSQGGAVAGGVYRYCNEHKESGLRLAGAVCGDGPYDPMATLSQYIDYGYLRMPVAAALILKGAVDTNPRMKELGCTYADFCTEEFIKTGVFDWLTNKTLPTSEMNKKVFSVMGYDPDEDDVPIEKCIKPSLLAYFKDGSVDGGISADKLQALQQCLEENALSYGGWTPPQASGLTFFHAEKDKVVPIINLYSMDDQWYMQSNHYSTYIYTSTTNGTHVAAGTMFLIMYSSGYTDAILSGKWSSQHKTL